MRTCWGKLMNHLQKKGESRATDDTVGETLRKPYEEPRMETLGSLEDFTRQTQINLSIN